MSENILVIGATGNIGSKLVRRLVEQGRPPRAFVRNLHHKQAQELRAMGVYLALGDLEDPSSIDRALTDIDATFLLTANGPNQFAQEQTVIDSAGKAGVSHIVKLSGLLAQPNSSVKVFREHAKSEAHLRASGIRWTILNPSFFMSNIALMFSQQLRAEGVFSLPAQCGRVACIDPQDVADVAAALLLDAASSNRTLTLTGPESLSFDDIAREISTATGTTVRYVDISVEAFTSHLMRAGLPKALATDYGTLFAELGRGVAERVSDHVTVVLGRDAHSFRKYANIHATSFFS